MKGKVGLIVGLAAGYVLGTRAGRDRYEQIKDQATKVWELDPVQNQVDKVKAFGTSALQAVPGIAWSGAKRVVSAAGTSGSPKERASRAGAAAKTAAKDVADAVGDSVDDAKEAGATTSTSSPTPGANTSATAGS